MYFFYEKTYIEYDNLILLHAKRPQPFPSWKEEWQKECNAGKISTGGINRDASQMSRMRSPI